MISHVSKIYCHDIECDGYLLACYHVCGKSLIMRLHAMEIACKGDLVA